MKILRGALLSNLTLTHFILDVGLGRPAGCMGKSLYKDFGDKVYGKAVKSLVAIYSLQRGDNTLLDVCDWLSKALGPLIDISGAAFFDL